MSYRSVIARQLHKRMSHHYTQASLANPYVILLSTIIRDFGLTPYERVKDNLRELEKALEEMKTKDVIVDFKVDKCFEVGIKSKLIDAKITIIPHPHFTNEMVKANRRLANIKAALPKKSDE
jgi:hypothetical protein